MKFLKSIFNFEQYEIRNFCISLVLCIAALSAIGVVMLNSAMANDLDRDATMMKQIFGLALGTFAMLFLTFVDYHFILKLAPAVFVLNTALLVLVLTPLGVSVNGAQRWLKIGIQIQPSEFAKIFLIIFLAWFFWVNESRINRPVVVFGGLFLFLIPAGLVLKEPDLSTTLVLAFIFVAILYSARISYRWIGLVIAIAIPVGVVGFMMLVKYQDWFYANIYQARRILTWLYPDKYVSTGNDTQQLNSVMAIASGQLFGKGINNTSFESVKNGNFLSEENCDFIFAVIGEELGFTGSVIVIALMLCVVLICLRIASRARDASGRFICVGMASLVAFQSFANIGVASKLLPNTGLPLPFISAGVSSLLSIFVGMGLVLNVGMQRKPLVVEDW